MKLSIVCLNTYGMPLPVSIKIRYKLIIDELQKIKPDIISLQEVWLFSGMEFLISKLKDSYNYYPDHPRLINSCGLVTFIRKNINSELVLMKRFDRQGPLELLCIPDRVGGKGYQVINLNINNRIVNFINCHTLCQYNRSPEIVRHHKMQIDELGGCIKNMDGKAKIVTGDLNDDPDSNTIKYLKLENDLYERLGLSDISVDLENLNRGKIMNMFSDGHSYRTDYVFVSKNIKINNQNIIFDKSVIHNDTEYNLSDHYGIYTEIEI
jgi:endonuclease/exonuclease/phosphatase family metal-dependent hydrolase